MSAFLPATLRRLATDTELPVDDDGTFQIMRSENVRF